MGINAATPRDTYTHVFGCGALTYSWWLNTKTTGVTDWDSIADDWSAEVTCEDGDGGQKTATVTHKDVLRWARKVIANPPKYSSSTLVQECKNLVFNNDDTDIDAVVGDELLQLLVLGEIVFG